MLYLSIIARFVRVIIEEEAYDFPESESQNSNTYQTGDNLSYALLLEFLPGFFVRYLCSLCCFYIFISVLFHSYIVIWNWEYEVNFFISRFPVYILFFNDLFFSVI